MDKYLVFRLYGPMAAWGEIAVGEVRHSASYPSRSAILGIISASLGIKRDDMQKLTVLFAGYDVGIKVHSPGVILKDYHTIQVPDSAGRITYFTRRDEIITGKDRLGTILSTREYLCDALSIISLRQRKSFPYSLENIQIALKKPKYILYLGRKSCPLSLPLQPQILSAAGFLESFNKAVFSPLIVSKKGEDITNYYLQSSLIRYYWEGEAGDMQSQEIHERYDEPLNRQRWQFATRKEYMMSEKGGE